MKRYFLATLGGVLIFLVGIGIFAFATAQHWEKVDVPEQAETFRVEKYKTGKFNVIDDHQPPCYPGQIWEECTAVQLAQYNGACLVDLTPAAQEVCDGHKHQLEYMQSMGGGTVSEVGTRGGLTMRAETSMREVSNNDYRSAETHTAVCYLGFLGECP